MATTFIALASTTVGSGGAATIDFTSISGSYTDLAILVSGRTTGAASGIDITFNSNTSSYSNITLQSNGASVSTYGTYGRFAGIIDYSTETSSTFGNTLIYIPSYTGSGNKAYYADGVGETNGVTAYMAYIAGLWSNTSAITSITLTPVAGSFVQYSTATLYGISKS